MPGAFDLLEQRVVVRTNARFANCTVSRPAVGAPDFAARFDLVGDDLGFAHGLKPTLRGPVQGPPLTSGESILIDNVAHVVATDPDPDGSAYAFRVVVQKARA